MTKKTPLELTKRVTKKPINQIWNKVFILLIRMEFILPYNLSNNHFRKNTDITTLQRVMHKIASIAQSNKSTLIPKEDYEKT